MRKRVIPVLLLVDQGLHKTVKFKNPVYVGDPLNAVKIFNEKEVDELIFLDIHATRDKREPDYEFLKRLAGECFMPLTYGGGINHIDQIRKLNACGIEKVSINSASLDNLLLIREAANTYGSSTIVVSVDVRQDLFGRYKVYGKNGSKPYKLGLWDYLSELEAAGAGEILLTNIDKEGTYSGYDLKLIEQASAKVKIPLIANGGASSFDALKPALKAGASAVAAGSIFVFYGPHKAVLINYPSSEFIDALG
jgi:cyclase